MEEMLTGWKEISSYLRVSEKTALRYKEKGLPIKYDPVGHPIIKKSMVDKWKFQEKAELNQI